MKEQLQFTEKEMKIYTAMIASNRKQTEKDGRVSTLMKTEIIKDR